MRRFLVLGVAAIGLLDSGCRSSCSSRDGLFDRLAGRGRDTTPVQPAVSRDPCCDGVPTAVRQSGSPTVIGTPVAGWPGDPTFGFPVYPNGTPYPVMPGGSRPANELPYPTILPPGVPEAPAQPMPAVPGGTTGLLPQPGARTTGDGKK
jgi:hypothetical protein